MDVSFMEPMLPDISSELEDIVLQLTSDGNRFAAQLHPILARSIGDLVRSMNCYYSNLIEGHNTELVEIQRAMESNFSADVEKRNLQLEARAHIEVQRSIDHGEMPHPAISDAGVCWIHRQFYLNVPEELWWVRNRDNTIRQKLVPGEIREHDVKVGEHEAPPPEVIPAMLHRLTQAYDGGMVSPIQKLVGIGASHHRFVWIHPFLDGNGRVSRLMSHARLRELRIGSELWSVSRGLARHVDEYKAFLKRADMVRQGSLDGRGNLSESGLSAFTKFFLETALDQIHFMSSLIQPQDLRRRIETWTREEVEAGRLLPGSWPLLREVITEGQIARGQAPSLTGYEERQARTVLSRLIKRKLLMSDSEKGPVRLGIPADVVDRWFPGLYVPRMTSTKLSKTQAALPNTAVYPDRARTGSNEPDW